MAIETGPGKKFLEELPLAIHTLSEGTPSDTLKIALYGPSANLHTGIDSYVTAGEVVGGGYSAGGITLTGMTMVGKTGSSRAGGVQFADAYLQPTDDTEISIAGVGVRGLMMYNSSQGDRNIFTLDFGTTVTPSFGINIAWGVAGVALRSDVLIPIVGLQF